MFVYSVKTKQLKVLALVVFVIITVVCLFILSKDSSQLTSSSNKMVLKATTHEDRMSFISQLGWEIDEASVEVCEVILPSEPDNVFSSYNEIQKTQGYDLTKYMGKRVKRWTYTVKNYPNYENTELVHINLLVYDDKIIGGDICSVELNGFMYGLSPIS